MKLLIFQLLCVVLVFNVTDNDGNKITDEGILDYIQKVSCVVLLVIVFGIYFHFGIHNAVLIDSFLLSFSVTWSRFLLCILNEKISWGEVGDGPHID